MNQLMLEPDESLPVCGKTVEEVMGSIQVMFGTACEAGVEQILYVVKLPDDRYELRRGDTGDGTPTNVRFCAPVRFDGVPLRIPKCTRALKTRH